VEIPRPSQSPLWGAGWEVAHRRAAGAHGATYTWVELYCGPTATAGEADAAVVALCARSAADTHTAAAAERVGIDGAYISSRPGAAALDSHSIPDIYFRASGRLKAIT
jgi:hypothetical protein